MVYKSITISNESYPLGNTVYYTVCNLLDRVGYDPFGGHGLREALLDKQQPEDVMFAEQRQFAQHRQAVGRRMRVQLVDDLRAQVGHIITDVVWLASKRVGHLAGDAIDRR